MSRFKRQTDTISPILEQILVGGSSVSLNLIDVTSAIPEAGRLFNASRLNNSIIFKYPNFDMRTSSFSQISAAGSLIDQQARPVETGIYVPNTSDAPEGGGIAVYMRGRGYEGLLVEQFGLTPGTTASDRDLRILHAIDNIPSLDPFLLKDCFETEGMEIDPRHWQISSEDDRELRSMIQQRIEPIVQKAFECGRGHLDFQRFLDAIWDSKMEEAGLFVSAFGIQRSEADAIFSAWKGTTFYEYQLRRIAPRARTIVAWLKSRDSVPVDIRMHKPYETQLLMHSERVGKLLEGTLRDIRAVMAEYEASFTAFMAGKPQPFRDYLRTIRSRYWLLGYCVSALTSVAHLDQRVMRNNPGRRLYFENLQILLRQFEMALDRRREQKGAF